MLEDYFLDRNSIEDHKKMWNFCPILYFRSINFEKLEVIAEKKFFKGKITIFV